MIHPQRRLIALVVAIAGIAGGGLASAQDARPFTVGVDVTALGLDHASSRGIGVPGAGLRVEWPFTRRLDVQAKAAWFPSRTLQEFRAQGGRTVQIAAGLRGKFLTTRHVSLYGVLLPQVLYVTDTVTASDGPTVITGGLTHFALDTGIGVEVAAGTRWAGRAEITGPLYFIPGREVFRSAPAPTTGAVLIARVAPRAVNPWQVSAGLSYRIGQLRPERPEAAVEGRWELGAQLTSGTTTGPWRFSCGRPRGAGASPRIAWRQPCTSTPASPSLPARPWPCVPPTTVGIRHRCWAGSKLVRGWTATASF